MRIENQLKKQKNIFLTHATIYWAIDISDMVVNC